MRIAVPTARSRDRHQSSIPSHAAAASNDRWRPVGLGRDGSAGRVLSAAAAVRRAGGAGAVAAHQEEIYFHALERFVRSRRRARARMPPSPRRERRAASCSSTRGVSIPATTERWERLRERIRAVGLRNSLLMAIAPTATIASIAGCYECIEPQISNLFKRETLSGDFLQINRYLVGGAEGARTVDR